MIVGRRANSPSRANDPEDPRAGDLAHGFDGREARPRVHEDQAPRDDPDQRAQGVGPKRQSRDAARQVDQEERERRDQPQEEKVGEAVLPQPPVDPLHPRAELPHHPVPQQRPADEEREDRPDGGARHHEQRPLEDPEDRSRGKGQDGRPRQGERGLDDVDQYEDGGEQEGVRGAQIRKPRPVRLEAFQRQVLPQVEEVERRHDRGECKEDQDLPGFHPDASSSGVHALPFRSKRNRRIFFVRSPNSFSE